MSSLSPAGPPGSTVWTARARGAGALVAALAGIGYFLSVVDNVYPVKTWLFWTIAPLWVYSAFLSLAWVALGSFLLDKLFRIRSLPLLETLVQSAALGSVGFVLLLYIAGTLRLFGKTLAVALPLGLILLGSRSLWFLWERARRTEPLLENGAGRVFLGAILSWGAFSTAMVYLQALTPDAINFDAAWCHLTSAQDYAREGRIVPQLADYARELPNFTGFVHSWAFSVPGLDPAQRWMLALHDEVSVLLWSLAGVSAAARWMLDDVRVRGTWVAFFLFPNIYVYDSNIGGAADHFLAFFAAPCFLAAARCMATSEPRVWILLGVLGGGALLTKYQAVYLLGGVGAVPGVALLLRWARTLRARRAGHTHLDDTPLQSTRALLLPPVLAGVALVAVSSPYFLRNYLFHANPVYPFAQDIFTRSHPAVPQGAYLVEWVFKDKRWTPKGSLFEKIGQALKLVWTFSLEPHYSFTKNVPSFGSVFSLLLPVLPFLGRGKRLWVGAAAGVTCILLWAMTFRVDRNLQTFVPILAAFSAAALVRAWHQGLGARVAAVALVSVQVVWGGDAMFFSGDDRLASAISLLTAGYDGRAKTRLDYRKSFTDVTEATPKNARILIHNFSLSLGIDREIWTDHPGHQGQISFDHLDSAKAMHGYFRGSGITHVLNYAGSQGYQTKQGEVLFTELLRSSLSKAKRYGSYDLHTVLDTAPLDIDHPYMVLVLGTAGYAPGLYPIKALSVVDVLPADKRTYPAPETALPAAGPAQVALVRRADAVVAGSGGGLSGDAAAVMERELETFATFPSYSVKLRRR